MKFSVPDEDSDMSDIDEQQDISMGMDIDGSSFDAGVDGITEAYSKPEAQAQYARQAQLARIQNENLSQHQQSRPSSSFRSSRQYQEDTPMLYDVPSSIGKRKRSESQPPARDTYHTEPESEAHTIDLRRFGGMFTTMYTVAATWLAGVWGYFTRQNAAATQQNAQDQEIFAVETDHSGRKRRAIPSGSYPHTSEAPKSQGSTSSTQKKNIKTSPTPGAYPIEGAPPSPESMSPEADTFPPMRRKNHNWRDTSIPEKNKTPSPVNPYYYENLNTIDFQPTLAEFRRKYPGGATKDHWEMYVAEKREERRQTEASEHMKWIMAQDLKMHDEEIAHEKHENARLAGPTREAQLAAAREKFGENANRDDVELVKMVHALDHREAACGEHEHHQKYHEYHGLWTHEQAKILEAEVARETKEYNDKLNADESSAFQKTSAYRKSKAEKAAAATQKKTATSSRKGASQQNINTPKTSPSTNATTPRVASYKEGLQPSPQPNAPGADERKPWSYSKTVRPGKSVLKQMSKAELKEAKDSKVDQLIEKSRKVTVMSPQEKKTKEFMSSARAQREEIRAAVEEGKKLTRQAHFAKRDETDVYTRQRLEDVRKQWEDMRIAEEAQKQAEEEEVARKAAEELAKKKAIEDELARKAAEEAAQQKALEEEKARKATVAQTSWDEKQKLIRQLDPEWEDRVATAMQTKGKHSVLAKVLTGTELTRHDFGTILPQEGTDDDSSGWLNDEIVNGWFIAMCEAKNNKVGYKKGRDTVPTFESYNSAWYNTVKDSGGVQAISRWSRRKNLGGPKLLGVEKVFFPINTGAHWELLIISPKERKIEVLDSLHRWAGPYFKLAREWLKMELGDKAYTASEWREVSGKSSAQTNSDDCGVFVVWNGLAAAKGVPYDAVKAGEMKLARRSLAAILLNGGMTNDWEL